MNRYPPRIEVAKAALNSNRFPYGPRPTISARTTSDATSSANAPSVIPIAARDSGVGEAERVVGADDDAVRDVTNEPVTPLATSAGWPIGAGARASSRRPLASRTACPTWAANPMAVASTPSAKRIEESCSICSPRTRGASRSVPAGLGQAAARPPGGGPARRARRTVGLIENESPQLPQVSIAAERTREHLGHATRRFSPLSDRVAPGS